MSLIIDQVKDHDTNNTGDNTVPPGITGTFWCHLVSTSSLLELETFLTTNSIGDVLNVRTPAVGSRSTYIGLDQTQHDAAVAAGAVVNRQPFVATNGFDATADAPHYEP